MVNRFEFCGNRFIIVTDPFGELAVTGDKPDVIIRSFSAFDSIDLVAEIEGKSGVFRRAAAESAKYSCALFLGVKTHINGIKHISAAVFNKGRLHDLADRTLNIAGDEFCETDKIKVFKTDKSGFAVFVDTDCLNGDNWAKSAATAKAALCIIPREIKGFGRECARLSARHKLPYVLVGDDGTEWGGR